MPDHVHIILRINNEGGRMVSAPTVIAGMKRYVSKKCGVSIWQKSYYDHIIRNQKDYNEIWEYIEHNPEKEK
jgi:REP element-mobilizing transposase RayT